ncbi:TPA: hypothetical protein ACGIK9_002879 [Acinetobacter baumannii]|uniref:hypothetical protein n=1 Tax=Acinetobacter baumannii TaxID=470 RepID=UPI00338FF7DF
MSVKEILNESEKTHDDCSMVSETIKDKDDLNNKIESLRDSAKKSIKEVNQKYSTSKQSLRAVVYDLNRKIKNTESILITLRNDLSDLKQSKACTGLPSKYLNRLKKEDIKHHEAKLKIFYEAIEQLNIEIKQIEQEIKVKVEEINTSTNQLITSEREKYSKLVADQREKKKNKAKSQVLERRKQRQITASKKREASLAALRHYLPLNESKPFLSIEEYYPHQLGAALASSFSFDTSTIVDNLIKAKSFDAHFKNIYNEMVAELQIGYSELLIYSVTESKNQTFKLQLHTIKNRKVDSIFDQYGLVKAKNTGNYTWILNFSKETEQAYIHDLELFFKDISKHCKFIFDAGSNSLFKVL